MLVHLNNEISLSWCSNLLLEADLELLIRCLVALNEMLDPFAVINTRKHRLELHLRHIRVESATLFDHLEHLDSTLERWTDLKLERNVLVELLIHSLLHLDDLLDQL